MTIMLDSSTPLLTIVNTMEALDGDLRRAALALLARGEGSPAEIAEALGLPRQTVHRWAVVAGVDWRRVRRAYLVKRLSKERSNGPRLAERPGKAGD